MSNVMKMVPIRQVVSPVKKFFGLSLSVQILIGLGLGIFTGIFFGERCAMMRIPATIFISFLQVSVLPYVVCSLIHGIGSLDRKTALKLTAMGGMILLVFWGLSLFFVSASQLTFPDWQSSRFFSNIKDAGQAMDYYKLYIPSNPFYALTNDMVPAVVVFSLLVGGCLIGVDFERKQNLLQILGLLTDLLSKLTHLIVRFTPLGVFAMAANAAGTLTADELGRIQIFICAFIIAALLLAFVALPLLVSVLTPFRYGDFLKVSKDAMMTAFTTANLLVILPLAASGIKELMSSYNCYDEESNKIQQAVLPVYFNFPDSGKMLGLIFILFAGWFTGHPLDYSNYPLFITTGLFGMFASANVTIPFLLNLFGIPPDTFQIYLMAGIFNGNFGTLTAAVDIFAFTTLCICSMKGLLRLSLKRTAVAIIAVLAVSILAFGGAGKLLGSLLKPKDYVAMKLVNMKISHPVKTVIHKKLPSKSIILNWFNVNLLKKILQDGVIKVGYLPQNLPFSYQNFYLPGKDRDILQGFDASMINDLAVNLNCRLEYYPVKPEELQEALNNNVIDIAVGGIGITLDTVEKFGLTQPVLTLHPAFVAKFDKIANFKDIEELKIRDNLLLAYSPRVIPESYLKRLLPKAKLRKLDNPTDYYEGKIKVDACVISAEQGAAFSIIYPEYSYVTPDKLDYSTLTAFAVNKTQMELILFLNNWLIAQKAGGRTKKFYDYWILGKDVNGLRKKRWCLLDNVLRAE
jgi:Na+/H+-dicarboxylate symporter/ABC-type amino acid transport substrate-binding protein